MVFNPVSGLLFSSKGVREGITLFTKQLPLLSSVRDEFMEEICLSLLSLCASWSIENHSGSAYSCSGVAMGGRGDFKLVHDSIKTPVWSRRFVAKFV